MARSLRGINDNVDNMTLKQLEAIAENQYRSACCRYDYCPKSIEYAIAKRITDKPLLDVETMIINDLKSVIWFNTGLDQRSILGKLWLEDLINDAIEHGIL